MPINDNTASGHFDLMNSAPKISTSLCIDDALPGIWAARSAGRLVPFVGAGLSRPYCRGWPYFVAAVAAECKIESSGFDINQGPDALYRIADRAAAVLRLQPMTKRREILARALSDPTTDRLPDQAEALARHPWPLIVTTNYDDILPHLMHSRRPEVHGRSRDDCIAIARSLDIFGDPKIWYVQGFVPIIGADALYGTARADLVGEVVVGHQQYQQAINGDMVFRRTFAEVFRRRSLLFIGSGLAESYMVNLISEAMFALGPSPLAHFALFSRDDLATIDPEFLAVRLGITPVCYGDRHEDLAAALARIAEGQADVALPAQRGLSALSYSIPRGDEVSQQIVEVSLRFGELPSPSLSACIALSVGRDVDRDGRFEPGFGPMGASFFGKHRGWFGLAFSHHDDWHTIESVEAGRLFRSGSKDAPHPVFLIAAREGKDKSNSDARSLAVITQATIAALREIEAAGFEQVSMGILSAGKSQRDDRAYCLVAQLDGIRAFLRHQASPGSSLRRIELCIVDREIWDPIAANRLPVFDLLTSRLARVTVQVLDEKGAADTFALSVAHGSTVRDVLAAYQLTGDARLVDAHPLPTRLVDSTHDLIVFPGMTIKVYAQNY